MNTGQFHAGRVAQMYWHRNLGPLPRIPHLIGPGGVTDCFRCHSGAPCRGWIPAFGDLCVTPVAGDSVAEMPSREPPTLDSRLRGNDGYAKVRVRGNDGFSGNDGCSKVSVRGNDGGGGFGVGRTRSRLVRPRFSSALAPHRKGTAMGRDRTRWCRRGGSGRSA